MNRGPASLVILLIIVAALMSSRAGSRPPEANREFVLAKVAQTHREFSRDPNDLSMFLGWGTIWLDDPGVQASGQSWFAYTNSDGAITVFLEKGIPRIHEGEVIALRDTRGHGWAVLSGPDENGFVVGNDWSDRCPEGGCTPHFVVTDMIKKATRELKFIRSFKIEVCGGDSPAT